MTRSPSRLLVPLAATVLLALASGCEGAAPPRDAALRPVRGAVVDQRSRLEEHTLPGVVKAAQEARLSFKIDGTI